MTQFATSGGTFLIGVNGHDPAILYNGTTWTATTITGVDTADLVLRLDLQEQAVLRREGKPQRLVSGGRQHRRRRPPSSRSAASTASAAACSSARRGTSRAATASTSRCIFVTGNETNGVGNEGEIAVYAGIDPSDPNQWGLIGVYRSGMPMGKKAHIRAGGDVIIATDLGLVPLSVAIQRDIAALAPSSLSYAIEDDWGDEVDLRSASEWKCKTWPTGRMTVVMLPTVADQRPKWFVGNWRTGAWCVFTGWDAKCVMVYHDRLFFGSTGGQGGRGQWSAAWTRALPYTATLCRCSRRCGRRARLKVPTLARAVLRVPVDVNPSIKMQTDLEHQTCRRPRRRRGAARLDLRHRHLGHLDLGRHGAQPPTTRQRWVQCRGRRLTGWPRRCA